jgi:hypothetical protein
VAQLGARVNGIHEVTGSIPVSSTNSSDNLVGRTPNPLNGGFVYFQPEHPETVRDFLELRA